MPTHDVRFRRHLRQFAPALVCLLVLAACEEDQAPTPLPAGISLVSGDDQYTKKGTQLEDPIVVRVGLEDGKPAAGVDVLFQVITGGGSLSRTATTTNSEGRASVRWTVGPDTGDNQLRISIAGNASLNTVASAISSEYFCPEEDPAFVQKFFPTHDVMLLTRWSSFTQSASGPLAGLVQFAMNTAAGTYDGAPVEVYDEGAFDNVVRDCAFSASGDLYISWNHALDEVMKVASNGEVSHFATLEPAPIGAPPGAELAMTPEGVLMGCDAVGPFAVTCRDTVFRYEDATFSGANRDAANNDALACDPNSGDLYFIYKSDRTLRRIPLDGTTQTGAIANVVTLPIDESDGARGMVVDGTDGSVYILVDSDNTKSIVKVTSLGVKTTAFDFFSRGAGDAAGNQSDLAIDRQATFRFLWTLDTLNNQFLLYDLKTGLFAELDPSGNLEAASNSAVGERVGLDVIQGAGP